MIKLINIKALKALLTVENKEKLTSGMANAVECRFQLSGDWDGLTATAVFTDGTVTRDVVLDGTLTCCIPHECLTTAGRTLTVGLYGTDGDNLILPTIYALLGVIAQGADPGGDLSADPTLPVWAEMQTTIDSIREAADNGAFDGADGSDASVTAENIATALGYTPAKPEGTYELIEKIIVGYSVTTQQPADWSAAWTSYYTNTGTAKEPVYTAVGGDTAPTWEAGTYFAYDGSGVTSIERTQDPDGIGYDFAAAKLVIEQQTNGTAKTVICNFQNGTTVLQRAQCAVIAASDYPIHLLIKIIREYGHYVSYNEVGTHGYPKSVASTVNNSRSAIEATLPITLIRYNAYSNVIPTGTTIEIWAVRA